MGRCTLPTARNGRELTTLLTDEHVLLVLLGGNLAIERFHVLGQLRLFLQLPLAAALRTQAVCFHALVLYVWAASIVAVVVQLHSRGSESQRRHTAMQFAGIAIMSSLQEQASHCSGRNRS